MRTSSTGLRRWCDEVRSLIDGVTKVSREIREVSSEVQDLSDEVRNLANGVRNPANEVRDLVLGGDGTAFVAIAGHSAGYSARSWGDRLGNRSPLEWVLDQYKEKTPRDATIREKFNTYRFADHKEKVIDLLARVTRVSVET